MTNRAGRKQKRISAEPEEFEHDVTTQHEKSTEERGEKNIWVCIGLDRPRSNLDRFHHTHKFLGKTFQNDLLGNDGIKRFLFRISKTHKQLQNASTEIKKHVFLRRNAFGDV